MSDFDDVEITQGPLRPVNFPTRRFPTSTSGGGEPTAPNRSYPTARPTTAPPQVPLGTDFTEHYAAGGYPDVESAGLDYAAGQRMAARANESRTALTTEGPLVDDDSLTPATAQTPPNNLNAVQARNAEAAQ